MGSAVRRPEGEGGWWERLKQAQVAEHLLQIYGWLFVLLCHSAWAQAPSFDVATDFESASSWDSAYTHGGTSFNVDAASGHRGNLGLWISDGDATNSSIPEIYLEKALPSSGDHFALRFWFRLRAFTGTGNMITFQLRAPAAFSNLSLVDLVINIPTGTLVVEGIDQSQTFLFDNVTGALTMDQWHLFEAKVEGLNTSNGARTVWLDGQRIAQRQGIDWTGVSIYDLLIGEPYCQTCITVGNVDLDDLRGGAGLHPTFLDTSIAAPTFGAGSCIPVALSLRSVDANQPAPAPYPMQLTVQSSSGTGSFFSDPSCQTPLTDPTLTAGASSSEVFFLPSQEGPETVTAAHPDLLNGSAATFSVDNSPPSQATNTLSRGLYRVGCGYQSDDLTNWGWLVGLLMRGKRRKAQPSSPSSPLP